MANNQYTGCIKKMSQIQNRFKIGYLQNNGCQQQPAAYIGRGAGRSIIGGGPIFIYSCSAQLISFEIVI